MRQHFSCHSRAERQHVFWENRSVDLLPQYLIASELLNLRLCSSQLRDSAERWRKTRVLSKRCEEAFGQDFCAYLQKHNCTVVGSAVVHCLEHTVWPMRVVHILHMSGNYLNCLETEALAEKFFGAPARHHTSGNTSWRMETREGEFRFFHAPQGPEAFMAKDFALDFTRLEFDGKCVRIYCVPALRTHESTYKIPTNAVLPYICHRPVIERVALWHSRGYTVKQDFAPCIHFVRGIAAQGNDVAHADLDRNACRDCRSFELTLTEFPHEDLHSELVTVRFTHDSANKRLLVVGDGWQVVFEQNRKRKRTGGEACGRTKLIKA